jgi:hypothetical protein
MSGKDNFKKDLDTLVSSELGNQEKISAISDLIANLSPLDQNDELNMTTEAGMTVAVKANRPEMAAQFCFMRAKSEIAQSGMIIAEMKNITTAIDWFGFALTKAEDRYKKLDKELKTILGNTQSFINKGHELISENPDAGAVAYCYNTAGQIYGSHYLQLKLYYFKQGRPWRARFGNNLLIKWVGLDDLFVMDKKSRLHLNRFKKDCIDSLHSAVKIFRQIKAREHEIDSCLDLCLEHHSFNNPIRSSYYLLRARFMIWQHSLIGNERLQERVRLLEDMAFIGSNRIEKVTDILPDF